MQWMTLTNVEKESGKNTFYFSECIFRTCLNTGKGEKKTLERTDLSWEYLGNEVKTSDILFVISRQLWRTARKEISYTRRVRIHSNMWQSISFRGRKWFGNIVQCQNALSTKNDFFLPTSAIRAQILRIGFHLEFLIDHAPTLLCSLDLPRPEARPPVLPLPHWPPHDIISESNFRVFSIVTGIRCKRRRQQSHDQPQGKEQQFWTSGPSWKDV